jgi:hypothetical protein
MISIHYVKRQISPNLFKVDATTLQSATYRSSMILNEVSSLWFIENLQIPFKLILSIFFYILISFKALVCQSFTVPMEMGLKWSTTTCYKILKSFLQKSICQIFIDSKNRSNNWVYAGGKLWNSFISKL